MNIVHLSPHFPPNYHLFSENLARFGARALGITDRETWELPHAVQDALFDHVKVPSLHDTEAVLAAAEVLRRRHGPLHRVESHLETWLELEAFLRERLDIPGLRPEELVPLKHKSGMKALFRRAGVEVARAGLLTSADEARRLAGEVGFPVIVKPDVGVGAQDTHRLDSAEDLERFLRGRDPTGYLMEEFIDGEIVTFDGLTGCDGRVLFCTSHEYSHDARRIAAEGLDFYYFNQRELPVDLERAGHRLVEEMGVREKFFHVEFFRRPSGDLLGIEINLRPPGGFTTDMFDYAHDIDVYALWAGVVTGHVREFAYERRYHCAHVSRRRRFHYRHSHEEVCAHLGDRLAAWMELNPLYATVMGEQAYLVRTPDLEELRRLVAFVHELA